MNYFGVVYKITQIKDENGIKMHDGGTLIVDGKRIQKGNIRIGRALEFYKRLNTYQKDSTHKTKNLHFENALAKYGWEAYKIEIIAVCRTEKEYVATEYFWQLYYNRKANEKGYDLKINENFNARFGSRGDKVSQYHIPKSEVTSLILQNYNKKQIRDHFAQKYFKNTLDPSTLDSRLIKYFGTKDLLEIQLKFIKPILESCFKKSLNPTEAKEFLFKSGITWYNNKYTTKLGFHIKRIYEREGIQFEQGERAYYKVYLVKFLKPFVEHLRELGIEQENERKIYPISELERDDSNGRYLAHKYDFTEQEFQS